ncbi:hypothetical protein [Candidatus Borrarchaeum sp.]|uniref:hypothetical protein n=1 Tax=Candidatus Borrarchaeum sp. TaxID=2846742 RepID=UPI00257BD65B|nr:hypothetical protein [Candidatus Borrarchaeum sp.]
MPKPIKAIIEKLPETTPVILITQWADFEELMNELEVPFYFSYANLETGSEGMGFFHKGVFYKQLVK